MYYWENYRKLFKSGKLIWFGDAPDNDFWAHYWEKRTTPDFYRQAAGFDLRRNKMGRILLRVLPRQGLHLEAGCGAGFWVAALSATGYKIEGIELSQRIVDQVRRVAPGLPVREGNALSIDCPDEHYDSYISFGVVEHTLEGPDAFLVEAYRVLKPGGQLVITVPAVGPIRFIKGVLGLFPPSVDRMPFFQYGYSKQDLYSRLERIGFEGCSGTYLGVHRLLLEELSWYRKLYSHRGGRFLKILLSDTIVSHVDGHMLLVNAWKPG